MNSGSGWNTLEFNPQRAAKIRLQNRLAAVGGNHPPVAAILNLVFGLCFEIAGVVALVQLI